MKKKLIGVLIIIIAAFLGTFVITQYFSFVSQTVYDESTSHLSEIYHKNNQNLNNLIKKNWNYLHLWGDYLSDIENNESIKEYFKKAKEEVGFNNFYFIDHNSNYHTINNESGYLDFKNNTEALLINKKDVVVTTVVPNQPQYLLFASACNPGVYEGFNYEAIAISFTNEDIVSNLQINSFDNQSISYIIHTDGRIIVDTSTEEMKEVFNYFSILRESSLEVEEIDALHRDFTNHKSGSKSFKYDGTKYYIVYESVNVDDWIILGMVPTSIVNTGMSNLQTYTTLFVSSLAVIFVALVMMLIIHNNRKQLKSKDNLLISREELFKYLAINIEDISMMIDYDNDTLDYISPNVDKLLGLTTAELHQNIYELDSLAMGDNPITFKEQLKTLEFDKDKIWFGEYLHKNTNDKLWYQITARLTKILDKKKYILVMSDRTKERKQNQVLEKMAYEAQSANRAKSRFLSNMSHDIRTPMNAIVGFVTLAMTKIDDPEKIQDYLAKILSSSNHLLSLINDVLDMSKIESGSMRLVETESNIAELLHNLKTIVGGEINAKNLDFHMYITNVVNEDIYCDKIKFNQLMLNLLSNAIKYTPSGGKVSYSISQEEMIDDEHAMYVFKVCDTGIGMSSDFLQKIFEPFEREYSSTVNKIQGTGLGMSIAKNIVEMMKGTISITSEVGKGTEVELRIPFRLQPRENKDLKIIELCGLKGLVVDDDFNTCDSVTKMLMQVGMRAEWTLFGKEAVLRAKQAYEVNDSFSVYIIDWRLPDMNGLEVARQIRSLGDQTPIIILTAYDWSDIEEEAKKVGVNGFCSKPMFMSDLHHSLINAMADKHVSQKENNRFNELEFGQGKTVLVAEDNALNTEIAIEVLSSVGFNVMTAVNGEEAVKKVSNSHKGDIDLVLMDIQMPIMNGYLATSNIRKLPDSYQANIPVIAMTANAFDEDRDKAYESGMNGFITKPIDLNEVFKVIQKFIQNNENH